MTRWWLGVAMLVGGALRVGTAHAQVIEPVAAYAPKGRPGRASAQGGITAVEFLYVGVVQLGAVSTGAAATLTQARPTLGSGDFHSLAEVAVESSDGQQIVEIGWTVDHGVNGDYDPHVFAFHWIDGQPQCYNGCGWVQVSATARPGMRVMPGETHRYQIKLVNGDWWLFYDAEGMGYFPGTRWAGRYTQGGLVQWFGEVAAHDAMPCTQMGNGTPGDAPGAAAFAELVLDGPAGAEVPADAHVSSANQTSFYRIGAVTSTSFGFGGPGADGCCVPRTCTELAAECGSVVEPACGTTLACGSCGDQVTCSEDSHTCAGPPPEPGAGCCDTGRARGGGGALWLAAVVAAVLRRRRVRPGSASRDRGGLREPAPRRSGRSQKPRC